ncbi:MAG: YjbQ family protein [archaeon]
MDIIDKEIVLDLKEEFTSVKTTIQNLITEHKINDANIVCWVSHEVGTLVQLGWEDGLIDDAKQFLTDIAPEGKYLHHDEPGTPFRYNFHQHIRTKLIGHPNMTLIVKNGELFIGQYQDIYFYSPVYREKPNQRIFCRIVQFT